MKNVKIFCTSGGEEVVLAMLPHLRQRLINMLASETIAKHEVSFYANQNINVKPEDVRGCIVVVIHTMTPPVSDHVIELFALLQTLHDADLERLYIVFPYMPYVRSDIKDEGRISVMAQWFADTVCHTAPNARVLLFDSHAAHVKHYFRPTADEISTKYLMADYLCQRVLGQKSKEEWALVFADSTANKRYESIVHIMGLQRAYIDKYRPKDGGRPKIVGLVGDVKGKHCLLFDDEVLTAGTSEADGEYLIKNCGALSVPVCAAAHGIFENSETAHSLETRGEKVRIFMESLGQGVIQQFIVGHSVPVNEKLKFTDRITVVPTEKFHAEAISRLILRVSLSELHQPDAVPLYKLH
ncbi:MAG: ribose-phosphate diphosphokinase [bacterium]|nr:ribose-phosphate diphosphokinase [bacterium]